MEKLNRISNKALKEINNLDDLFYMHKKANPIGMALRFGTFKETIKNSPFTIEEILKIDENHKELQNLLSWADKDILMAALEYKRYINS